MADTGTSVNEISLREFPPTEWDRLKGLIPQDDWIPDPANGRIMIAERNGSIIGFCVIQLAVHIDPLWVSGDEQNGMTAVRLWNMAVENLKQNGVNVFYVFAETGGAAGYLERLGLKRLNFIPYAAGY